jgi:acyl-CoA thioester hydrolase
MNDRQTLSHTTHIRVRYSETDQMGTFYNSRALEWFEVGRTELLRLIAGPDGQKGGYATMEAAGVMLPLVEAHVEYLGRARYDDELEVAIAARMSGRARVRFDVEITHADGSPVAKGYTVHAVTGPDGKPIRPPAWFSESLVRP